MTGLDSNFTGEPPYSNFDFLEGPSKYDSLIQRETEYRGSGVAIIFEGEVFIDEYDTYRGVGEFWDIEVSDKIGVSYDDRENEDYFCLRFFDPTNVTVIEPFLQNTPTERIQHVAQLIKEFDVDHDSRVVWYVDDDRRVRIGIREFLSRTLNDYDPYLDERYR